MFELPIIDRSSKTRKRRKIRYQYINSFQRRFDQLRTDEKNGISTGILTPENSENSEAESADSEKNKRRRRRLQSILGHALDSSDEETTYEEDIDENSQSLDPEAQFFEKYFKPQNTYEIWNTNHEKRTRINRRRVTYNEFKKMEKYANKTVTKTLNYQTKKSNMYFQALKYGYDVYAKPELLNQKMMHIVHLNQLLHINVLNQNWKVAYRCFSLLIRLEDVDIRSIWAIGSKVISETQDMKQNESFLEWLSSVFSTKVQFNQGTNYRLDPVFRSGSRTHSPKFVLTWLWTRLSNFAKNHSENKRESSLHSLIERINEMVLGPPYMDDPEVWFILALTHIIMADQLSIIFRSDKGSLIGTRVDIARNQVIQHINHAKNCLQTCKSKTEYTFPEKIIEDQLYQLERSLYPEELSADSGGESDGTQEEYDDVEDEEKHETVSALMNLDTQKFEIDELVPEIEEHGFGEMAPIDFGYDSDESN